MAKNKKVKSIKKSASKNPKMDYVKRAKADLQKAKIALHNHEKKLTANIAKAKTTLKLREKQVETYIRKNPKKAAAIAAGVGVVVGAVIGVMKRRK